MWFLETTCRQLQLVRNSTMNDDRARHFTHVKPRLKKHFYRMCPPLGKTTDHARAPFKGGEAKDLVDFVVRMLQNHAPIGNGLLVAGKQLQRLISLIDESPLHISEAVAAEMRQAACDFLIRGTEAGMRPIPKFHQLLHMVHDLAAEHGNPRFYSNWTDESLNRDLAGIARQAYSSVWAGRIMVCWRYIRDSRSRGLTIMA